ncbi:MAG TPA: hypothetical protein VEN28_02790, partial [Burkholderiaceae bacterium]|nr:hypothetical protein [Burkholderiaceae bacterium]
MTARHDPAGRRLPIKLDATSNGEYEPVPLTAIGHAARAAAQTSVDGAVRKLGVPRRRYLISLLGAAASLSAFDRTFAANGKRGGRYVVPEDARFESAAAQSRLAGDEFIFDVQLHHVDPQGAWRKRASPSAFRGMPKA